MSAPRLVIAGNLLVDDVVFADGRTRMGEAGGAVLYAASSASLWDGDIGCLSRLGDDYPQAALATLQSRGVRAEGVRSLGRAGGRTWLLYEGTQWRMVPRLGRPSHEDVSPGAEDIPATWRTARALHLAPMPFACQEALRSAFPDETFVSLDPHLPISEATLPRFLPLLARVDALFVGEDEIDLPALRDSPRQSLRRLCEGRLRYIAWKRGAAGGLLYDAHRDTLTPWSARAAQVVDPTGCGDSFAASFVTALLDGEDARAALDRGIVGASFALAGWGASALLSSDGEMARARLREWRSAK